MSEIDQHLEAIESELKANLTKAMESMAAEATPTSIKAYSAAKKALELFQEEQAQADAAERFKNIEQAASWIVGAGYLVSARTVRNHAERVSSFPRRQKDGSYLKNEITAYAQATWENPSRPETKGPDSDTNEQIKRETLRKLQISNDQKIGALVPLEDEIRRRVNVIAGMKIALDNQRPFFIRELVGSLRDSYRGKDGATEMIHELGEEAGHLYSKIVMRVFDAIGKNGGVKAPCANSSAPITGAKDR